MDDYDDYLLRIKHEHERLCGNTECIAEPYFLKVSYLVKCNYGAEDVVEKARYILKTIDKICIERSSFPTIEEWQILLPTWFVEKCKPERNQQQLEEYLIWWNSLSYEQKNQYTELPRSWELSAWIYYLHPDERQWYWYTCNIINTNSFSISLEVRDFPFLSGAFYWLLQSSGANTIEEIDD